MDDTDITAQVLVEQLWHRADGVVLASDALLPELPEYESPEHDENLRYLNTHWAIDPAPDAPGGGGVEWKDRAKRRLTATVLSTLRRYFEQERDYFAHSVRHANALAEWCGRLAREVRVVAQAIGDESRRLADRQDVLHARLEDRIAVLEARVAELEGRQ